MATINKLIVESRQTASADTPEVFYTSPATGIGTVITNFTASNDSLLDATYKAYIVASGAAGNPLVPSRSVITGRSDVSAEMAGQVIPAGGTLQMEASSAGTIAFTVSARELS